MGSNECSIIKERVITLLKEKNMTQKDLAEKLDISKEHLNRCLSKGIISKTWLLAICNYLDVSTDYLSGESKIALTRLAQRRSEIDGNFILSEYAKFLGFAKEQFNRLTLNDIEDINEFITFKISQSYHEK